MNINIGDKVITKEDTQFSAKGRIATVTDITNDSVFFAFDSAPSFNCRVNHITFNDVFDKVQVETEAPRITQEYINEIMAEAQFEVFTTFNKCTVVSCRLPNGFVITESSACVSPENYDDEVGFSNCYDKIVSKVWELEAYLLQEYLWENDMVADVDDEAECDGCGGCEFCPCCE